MTVPYVHSGYERRGHPPIRHHAADYDGKRFGTLVGTGREDRKDGIRVFEFACDCGILVWRPTHNLRDLSEQSGCKACFPTIRPTTRKRRPDRYFADEMSGKRFGSLVATGREKHEARSGRRWRVLEFICDCGVSVWRSHLSDLNDRSGCRVCVVKSAGEARKLRTYKTGAESNSWKGGEITPSRVVTIARSGALLRGIAFDIDVHQLDEIWRSQSGLCALTGRPLNFTRFSGKKHIAGTASIDRIDSSKGYSKDNVQWVHKNVNIAKRTLSNAEFIAVCREVVAKHG